MSNPVLFVVGPTGTGKSKLALELAIKLKIPLVNCDSVQIYQRVDIGSAKPTADEYRMAPHHLFDCVSPPHEITAGEYRRKALLLLAELTRTSPVIVVGGSGFYVQALQKGMWDFGPVSPAIRDSLEKELLTQGLPVLFEELLARDSALAMRIGPTDTYRILRALGIMRSQGRTVTAIRAEFDQGGSGAFPFPYKTMALDINRQALEMRLFQRAQKMLTKGLVEEVQVLLAEKLGDWAPLKSVGYKETKDYLTPSSKISGPDELVLAITSSSMKLAKRQRTWFRRDTQTCWFDGETQWSEAIQWGLDFLNKTSS